MAGRDLFLRQSAGFKKPRVPVPLVEADGIARSVFCGWLIAHAASRPLFLERHERGKWIVRIDGFFFLWRLGGKALWLILAATVAAWAFALWLAA